MKDLFTNATDPEKKRNAPLADRLRPRTLDEFIGQERLINPKSILRRAIENDELFSMILWGPPGSGKTTLARLIAETTHSRFVQLSAVASGIGDLRSVVERARDDWTFARQRTILFVDEIHRWNKAQQDALLPHVEDGTVILIGATTENPSFEIIAPLLSRCQVYVLERHSPATLSRLLDVALADHERGVRENDVAFTDDARAFLLAEANGDARALLNALEIAVKATPRGRGQTIDLATIEGAIQKRHLLFDKQGEEYYNVISAFIKSMRGSDPDGAVYWLARMLEAGQDPVFIARRMVVFASEDVSLADPNGLLLAMATFQAVNAIGLPECAINLAHCAIALALAPKNNSTYLALGRARDDVRQTLNEPVPLHLRNAPTKLMKKLGYGKGYKYSHDFSAEDGKQDYLPAKLNGRRYFVQDEEREEKNDPRS